MFGRRIRRSRSGGFEIKLPAEERHVLRSLGPQLRQIVEADQDPALRRLFPVAYHQDPDADAEFQGFMHDDLRTSRLAKIETFLATVDATHVSEEELQAWMGAVNDLRLVIGTKLDVSEEMDLGDLDDDHPDVELFAIYSYLGWLLEQIVGEIAGW
jgi:hypothetical protein